MSSCIANILSDFSQMSNLLDCLKYRFVYLNIYNNNADHHHSAMFFCVSPVAAGLAYDGSDDPPDRLKVE